MKFYRIISDGYILAVGTDIGGMEITAAKYDEILTVIAAKPARTETTDYRLKEDLTWEPYEVEPPDPDPELDGGDVLDILLGGAE
ncbi:MAG: hypothetical protein IKO83_05785 [Oscillospiraceae bacterium]|nr:hypothetical protein [Oscillospiraceae bacterium]